VSRADTPIMLVLFPGALGDCICFLPTLHALRARCGRKPLVLVAPAAMLPLLVRSGLADEGLPVESARVARLFVDGADPRDLVAGRPVGDVYAWLGSRDPAVRQNLRRLAGGVVRYGRVMPPQNHAGHVARHFLATADVSATWTPAHTRVPLSSAERAVARQFWVERGLAGYPVLAVHRGAGNPAKRWVNDGYRAVSAWWGSTGGKIVEVAGPADAYAPLEGADAVVRGRSLVEAAALLARATLGLGGDSGVMHLAGAVGLCGVVLFGPTEPRRWRPLGGRVVCLKSHAAPDAARPIPLEGISVDRVVRALRCVARGAR
jgi:ADP-heptose:LPS heptosyltransferase